MAIFKTGWLKTENDEETTRRFAWSHVKTIFYNKENNKLLKDKLDEMDNSINAKNGNVLMASNSVDAVESTYLSVCSLTLPAGHAYLVLGNAATTISDSSSIMLVSIDHASGTATRKMSNLSSRTTMNCGGGTMSFAYLNCQTDCVVILKSYGYSSGTYKITGNLLAIQLT